VGAWREADYRWGLAVDPAGLALYNLGQLQIVCSAVGEAGRVSFEAAAANAQDQGNTRWPAPAARAGGLQQVIWPGRKADVPQRLIRRYPAVCDCPGRAYCLASGCAGLRGGGKQLAEKKKKMKEKK